jgi:hypothetical protein
MSTVPEVKIGDRVIVHTCIRGGDELGLKGTVTTPRRGKFEVVIDRVWVLVDGKDRPWSFFAYQLRKLTKLDLALS